MKHAFLLLGFLLIVGCAKNDDHGSQLEQPPSSGAAVNTITTTNAFQKIDGCYQLVSPRLEGVQYLVEIKSESDPCSGASMGLTRFIVTSYQNGYKRGTSGFDTYISAEGKFVVTEASLVYEFKGPSSRYCVPESNMIQVERVAVERKSDNNLDIKWSSMHCSQKLGYDRCASLAPQPFQYQFKKSDDCVPQ